MGWFNNLISSEGFDKLLIPKFQPYCNPPSLFPVSVFTQKTQKESLTVPEFPIEALIFYFFLANDDSHSVTHGTL